MKESAFVRASALLLSSEISFSALYIALYLAITLDKVDTRADHLVSHNLGTWRLLDSLMSLYGKSNSVSSFSTTRLKISSDFRCLCSIVFRLALAPRNQVSAPKESNKFLISGTCL